MWRKPNNAGYFNVCSMTVVNPSLLNGEGEFHVIKIWQVQFKTNSLNL